MELTVALEDYLETIYELIRDKQVARVRDIANIRKVKPGSVTPAMKRLADLDLVDYSQREYIRLTPKGLIEARKIFSKHKLLNRLFSELLRLPPEEAQKNACAIEHNLTPTAMDKLAGFFEFLDSCTAGSKNIIDLFHQCSFENCGSKNCRHKQKFNKRIILSLLAPLEEARVVQISGDSGLRQQILEKGILPHTLLKINHFDHKNKLIYLEIDGFMLSLSIEEGERITVERLQ